MPTQALFITMFPEPKKYLALFLLFFPQEKIAFGTHKYGTLCYWQSQMDLKEIVFGYWFGHFLGNQALPSHVHEKPSIPDNCR